MILEQFIFITFCGRLIRQNDIKSIQVLCLGTWLKRFLHQTIELCKKLYHIKMLIIIFYTINVYTCCVQHMHSFWYSSPALSTCSDVFQHWSNLIQLFWNALGIFHHASSSTNQPVADIRVVDSQPLQVVNKNLSTATAVIQSANPSFSQEPEHHVGSVFF